MAAGNAQIKYLQENPYIYEEIEQKGAYLEGEFKKSAEKYGVNVRVKQSRINDECILYGQ